MSFSISREFSEVSFTSVENSFIKEYLPVSSGDAVKVYLYGLYLCFNGKDADLKEFSERAGLDEKTVIDCFKYWEEFGLLSLLSEEPLSVKYLPVHAYSSSKPRKYKAEKYTDFSKTIQTLLPSRMISVGEYTEYFNIMEIYGISPDAMVLIIKYCADLKGQNVGYKYIAAVAKNFGKEGVTTVEKVEQKLSSYVLFTGEIGKIIKALGLRRQPEIEDLAYLKKWTGELGFDVNAVVFAAGKLKQKHADFAKLDAFLLELYAIKSFSESEIAEYADKKQAIYDLALKINRALSVYMEVLDPVVETYTKKWLSYGFEKETLLLIASYCFKEGQNTLQFMDEKVQNLYSRGFIDLTSVSDYFEEIKKSDAFISKMLLTAGVNRRPNEWDRNNLATWKSWNFSEDMILEAAKTASGKNSPIPYMNGVLSNWKRDGVFTLSSVPDKSSRENSQEAYNLEYERRRNRAVSRAQKNIEKALEIEGFADIYGRLNSIERDLAFAEIGKNEKLLSSLIAEKAELTDKAGKLLGGVNLTLADLTPKYACEKCKDTGYVGTKRCDCWDKKN